MSDQKSASSDQKRSRFDPASFVSQVSSKREPNEIRTLLPLTTIPGMIVLAGGLPNPAGFPFETMTIGLKDGTKINWTKEQVDRALQYGMTPGDPDLIKELLKYMKMWHKPHGTFNEDWGIHITTGSQDALSKTIDMLLEFGDSLLLGDPAYPGALSNFRPKGCYLVGIDMDSDGLVPESIERQLANWETLHPGQRFPKLLYTIPTGSNPSGATLTVARKRQILDLASKYNLVILEDDPYYFLNFPDDRKEAKIDDDTLASLDETKLDWGGDASLFSMDTEGRVLRFDSFSKMLSAGIRIGWVSGHKYFIDRLVLHSQASVLHASQVSQMVILTVLQQWGPKGLYKQVNFVRGLYRSRRDQLIEYCNRYLTGKAKWIVPKAGMFVWFEFIGVEDTWKFVMDKMVKQKVLMVPGACFRLKQGPSNAVRAAFSLAPPDKLEEAMRRLAACLDEEVAEKKAAQ